VSPAVQRVADATLLEAYERLGSVDLVGAEVGLNRSSVHERLVKLGANKPINVFTVAEFDRLRRDYLLYRDLGQLSKLAVSMGRTVAFLARQARTLGLTDPSRPKPFLAKWKYLTEEQVALLLDDFKRSRLGVGQYTAKKGWDAEGFTNAVRRYFADEWDAVIESKAPRQGMYRLGRAVEYRVRDHLRRLGYFVLRSPASKSPLDLVAIAPGVVLFVQAKRSLALSPKDWNELLALAVSVSAVPILVGQPKGRGLDYFRLVGPKDGSKRRQPMVPFDPGEPGATVRVLAETTP
jgi:Holliday junction resolvase